MKGANKSDSEAEPMKICISVKCKNEFTTTEICSADFSFADFDLWVRNRFCLKNETIIYADKAGKGITA